MIISPYVLLIFLFVDGTVSSAIYYITFFCKVFSNATFTRSGEVSYTIQPTGFTQLMVNWCGPIEVGPLYTWGLIRCLDFSIYLSYLKI